MEQIFQESDRPLFNTGFWDGLNARRTDTPNPFWATAEQISGDRPITHETNKEFLEKHHKDRVFASAALIGSAAFEEETKEEPILSTERYWRRALGLPEEEAPEEVAGSAPVSTSQKKSGLFGVRK